MYLTATGGILGPIATLFGYLMNGIFICLEKIGIEKGAIGIAIIVFTLITRLILYPFTVQQQKSTKLMSVIQPEIKAIQAKYEGRKDQQSMMQQQAEIKAVYEKYGTSMTGNCVQLLIQMPIIFALYRVIMNVPAYVGRIKDHFMIIVDAMVADKGKITEVCNIARNFATNETNKKALGQAINLAKNFGLDKNGTLIADETQQTNYLIDFLYKLNPAQLNSLATEFSNNVQKVANEQAETIDRLNSFCGLNLATAPSAKGLFVWPINPYLIIPILAALSQYVASIIMQKQTENKVIKQDENDTMQQSMKTMNIMMPIMSAVFCYGFATGIGVYWIASSVFMVITQIIIYNQLKNQSIDDMIKKNIEKVNKKRAKKGLAPINAEKTAESILKMEQSVLKKEQDREILVNNQKEQTEEANKYYFENENPNSLFSKANMVQKYNEKNKK